MIPFFGNGRLLRCCVQLLLLLTLSSLLFTPATVSADPLSQDGRTTIDLDGAGWNLWQDTAAPWMNDELFFPADLTKIPTNAPTIGWDQLEAGTGGTPVSIPATAEQYLSNGTGPTSVIKGVTWWTRKITIPASAAGKTIRLQFEATRLRAEVYFNCKLVGYDIVGNTPYEINLTGIAQPGSVAELAVRITNPGGDYNCGDATPVAWGKYRLPNSHGFGGITGRVHLVITDPVYLDDVYVQNQPTITTVKVFATIKNTTSGDVCRDVQFQVSVKPPGGEPSARPPVFHQVVPNVALAPGDNTVMCDVSIPAAKIWDIKQGNLYTCSASLQANAQPVDGLAQTFGFRWFTPVGIGTNAMFRLNGKRVVLRTAISWGTWPITGQIPTPELAEREIRAAQAYGMNMLNFHRTLGNAFEFDYADQLGHLIYEEPGGYTSARSDPFSRALAREKLLRMTKRDRSHPSLVIRNMINEQWAGNPTVLEAQKQDMRDAHAIDPSRVLTYTSAWALHGPGPQRMNMRPFDDTLYMDGWWDDHRAGGPPVYQQGEYRDPTHQCCYTTDTTDIVYRGEECAISTPPRLGLMKKEIEASPTKGWDGQIYLDWYAAFDQFLTAKDFRSAFPTVDDLCKSIGAISLENQGRRIECLRICDPNDGYAINGWDATVDNDHSGVVDTYRNPKGDPAILAYYNQPFYVAVKARQIVAETGDTVLADFYAVNEEDVKGPHTLRVTATASDGKPCFSQDFPVNLTGGDVFGQLLQPGVPIPLNGSPGMYTINAALLDPSGTEKTRGHDTVFTVDWKSSTFSGNGAVYEDGNQVRNFLKTKKSVVVPAYAPNLPPLDWLVIARGSKLDPYLITNEFYQQPTGGGNGLTTTFFNDPKLQQQAIQRKDKDINFSWPNGANPDPGVARVDNYSVRWESMLMPPATGDYLFSLRSDDGVRLWINGKLVIDDWKTGRDRFRQGTVTLTANQAVPLKLEYFHTTNHDAHVQLLWQPPEQSTDVVASVFNRVQKDGTTLLIIDRPDAWKDEIARATGATFGDGFELGTSWVGGQYFVKDHPLFKDLPVNQSLSWPYQSVLDGRRTGLDLTGGECVVGVWNSWPFHLGTSVAVLPCGKGRIIVSTLDIAAKLNDSDSTAEVARKLFCNYLEYASKR